MTNEEINLAVASIAGWTDIENWNTSATKKTYIGTNSAHPELGKFIPKYTESLDAIVKVFSDLGIDWELTSLGTAHGIPVMHPDEILYRVGTPALALCKLLLAINPTPIAPPQVAIREHD
jgi:hypothetical protein